MARQPFVPQYRNADWVIGPGAIDHRPEFAALIGRCLTLWPEVELRMALVMAAMLKTNNEGAVALFLALRNGRAQREALNAVADATLSKDVRLTFSALQVVHGSIESQRNDLAHGLFGYSDAVPDGVLWTDTSSHTAFLAGTGDKMGHSLWSAPDDMELRKYIFVYKEKDLTKLRDEISEIDQALFVFQRYLWNTPENESEYQLLCGQPRIAQEISRLKSQKNT